ncbi:LysM peptidoglycan-binding domain-containing protein [Telluribacter sp. SYSU D00476]|uniref:LysM peptidoglycan-binding domain-containing protein n=1 Tax=Telluribacter sp. SYSU D00476 TaxID=2811430 RepID=UPI001FF567F4|nr:LysM peptidoglycan-binding domain-containing protein [Telluribacter sp. SYSU D00476]
MEEESPKKRNVRPAESSNLPLITLVVLVLIVLGLLFVGYEYIADDTTGSEELTNIVPDTTSSVTPLVTNTDPVLAEPERIDSSLVIDSSPATTTDEATEAAPAEVTEAPKPTPPAPKPAAKPADIGGASTTHTVKPGETFFGIASRYNLKPETLRSLNPDIEPTAIKSGVTRLNVRVKAVHTVGPGDVLRVVASKYGISKELLMQANGKSKDFAQRGEKLIIPFSDKK